MPQFPDPKNAPNFREVEPPPQRCKTCGYYDGYSQCERHNISLFDHDNLGDDPAEYFVCDDFTDSWELL